jgi:hypothetical protein
MQSSSVDFGLTTSLVEKPADNFGKRRIKNFSTNLQIKISGVATYFAKLEWDYCGYVTKPRKNQQVPFTCDINDPCVRCEGQMLGEIGHYISNLETHFGIESKSTRRRNNRLRDHLFYDDDFNCSDNEDCVRISHTHLGDLIVPKIPECYFCSDAAALCFEDRSVFGCIDCMSLCVPFKNKDYYSIITETTVIKATNAVDSRYFLPTINDVELTLDISNITQVLANIVDSTLDVSDKKNIIYLPAEFGEMKISTYEDLFHLIDQKRSEQKRDKAFEKFLIKIPGFCYLRIFANESWMFAASKLKLFPKGSEIKSLLGSCRINFHKVNHYVVNKYVHIVPTRGQNLNKKATVGIALLDWYGNLRFGGYPNHIEIPANLSGIKSFIDLENIEIMEEQRQDIIIGGEGDCWMKLTQVPIFSYILPFDRTKYVRMTMLEFAKWIFDSWVQFGDSRMFKYTYIKITKGEDGDYHLENVVVPKLVNVPKYKERGYTQIGVFLFSFNYDMYFIAKSATALELANFDISKYSDAFTKKVLVGTGAHDIITESLKINSSEIARSKAIELFESDYASTPKTKYRLDKVTQMEYKRWTNSQIISQHQKPVVGDHPLFAVAREQIRNKLLQMIPHNTDSLKQLHIGATVADVRLWGSHSGHDFYFHLGEDKDIPRTLEGIANRCQSLLKPMTLPAITTKNKATTVVKFKGISELSQFTELRDRKRIHLEMPNEQYTVLHFPDSLYDITPEQLSEYFIKTGALEGYGIIFIPDKFINSKAVDSELYNYHEYIPFSEKVDEIIDQIWPSILLLAPFLPTHAIAETFRSMLVFLIKHSWQTIIDWATSVITDDFPLEALVGSTFELSKFGPILKQLMKIVRQVIREEFSRISVTWKYGHSNGYDHKLKTWKYYAKTRRQELVATVNDGKEKHVIGYLDSEIIERIGEMYLIRFWRSSGTSPLVHQLSLPKHRTPVRILDLTKSIDYPSGMLLEPVWISINADDWWDVFGFCMSEPFESLNHAVLLTQISRRRRGLKLGTNVLVEPMSLQNKDLIPFAMAALMEACHVHSVLEKIEANDDLKDIYEKNITTFIKNVGKMVVGIATAGLVVPGWMLFKWLITHNQTITFVEYVNEAPRKVITSKPIGNPKQILENKIPIVFPHKSTQKPLDCQICHLASKGIFSKDGVYEHGQCFECNNKPVKQFEIGFTVEEMPNLMSKISAARRFHAKMKVDEYIKSLEDSMETFRDNGIKHQAELHYIRGGPGTGKTEVIKCLAKYFEELAYTYAIVAPFSDLIQDYKSCEIIGYKGRHTLPAHTTHYLTSALRCDILFVDECSAIDWELVRAMACKLSVKAIYLFGDAKQTALRPEKNEGYSIIHPFSGLNIEEIPTHELVKNFRLGQFRVKWCNMRYNYKMVSVRTDIDIPVIMSRAEYEEYKITHTIEKEMVFTHDTAQDIFGKESIAGDPTLENMSVRSAQGKTVKSAAIGFSSRFSDLSVSEAQGMMLVANTRSKDPTIWVVQDKTDPYWQGLKSILGITDPDAVNSIPLPELPRLKQSTYMSEEEQLVNNLLQRKLEVNEVDKWTNDKEDHFLLYTPKLCHSFGEEKSLIDQAIDMYKGIFHECFVDAISKLFPNDKENILEIYKQAYLSGLENQPNRLNNKRRKTGILSFFSEKDNKMKWLLDMNTWMDIIKPYYSIMLWLSFEGKRAPLNYYKSTNENAPMAALIYIYEENHILPLSNQEDEVVCINDSLQSAFNHSSKYLFEDRPITDYLFVDDHYDTNQLATEVDKFRRIQTAFGKNFVNQLYDKDTKLFRILDLSVGVYRLAKKPKFERDEERMLEEHMSLFSSWVYEEPDQMLYKTKLKTPIRLGTDAYKLADVIDPSLAEITHNALNWGSGHQGQTRPTNHKLNWNGFLFDRTKSGKLKFRIDRNYFSVAPGFGNHFNKTPEETLLACQRLGAKVRRPPLTAESRAFAQKLAENYFREVWSPEFFANPEIFNGVIERAMKDAKTRNYDGRRKSELQKSGCFGHDKFQISVFNKDQFKPTKSGKLDLQKGGQSVSQDPSFVNLNFMTYMRTQYAMQKYAASKEYFFDDFEDSIDFRIRVTEAIRNLPAGARYGISDGEEWDAQQNLVTQEFEKKFKLLTGAASETIEAWYSFRGDLPFIMHGIFSGTTGGAKTSGKLDTKGGNTDLQGGLSHHIFKGKGPKVVALKGDDRLHCQVGIEINEKAVRDIKNFMGMTIKCNIGNGGEFCGNSVSAAGMYPSVVRTALKTTARKANNYKQFSEQQQSLRDVMTEYKYLGLEEVVNYSAYAEDKDPNFVWACISLINSFAHISKSQWEGIVKQRKNHRHFLPNVFGYSLW